MTGQGGAFTKRVFRWGVDMGVFTWVFRWVVVVFRWGVFRWGCLDVGCLDVGVQMGVFRWGVQMWRCCGGVQMRGV